MNVRHENPDLLRLETDKTFSAKLAPAIVGSFRSKMNFIRNALDERDFRAMRSLRFEKLHGDRAGQWSMRLNDQYRLIMKIEEGTPKNTVVILEIADYH